jgi:hypothetical protein
VDSQHLVAEPNGNRDCLDIWHASGNVVSQNKVACLLYLLMRDHLPAGIIEKVAKEAEACEMTEFSNGWLAEYAIYIAERLWPRTEQQEQ